jgi:prepilin-type N-terminal cleavage/methylation domain-containing protein
MRPNGFTLIELMIAVALGMVIVYTATAGFRVAAQSTAMSGRLALENSLMRAGIIEAHQQLDFWTNLDDPGDGTRQRRRRTVVLDGEPWSTPFLDLPGTSRIGLPFSPMREVFPPNADLRTGARSQGSSVPRRPAADGFRRPEISVPASPVPAAHEQDIGFDPTYTWAPHDPCTWYRGNCLEKYRQEAPPAWVPPQKFGRYGIFGNIDAAPAFKEYAGLKAREQYADTCSASCDAKPAHLWYGRQLAGLARALGYYGLCDYLPSHALYNFHASYSGAAPRTSSGGQTHFFLPCDRQPVTPFYFVGQGMTHTGTLGLYSLTVAQSHGITNPHERNASDSEVAGEVSRYYDTDYPAAADGGRDQLQQFVRLKVFTDAQGVPRPAWPAPDSIVRCPMQVWKTPPSATSLTACYNPINTDQANQVDNDYLWPYLRYPDPQPKGATGKDGSFATPADRAKAWNDFLTGDPMPRVHTTGKAWFRILRDGPTTFLITCGAGGTAGFRSWSEVLAQGQGELFSNDRSLFGAMVQQEVRLWYRVEWSASSTELTYHWDFHHQFRNTDSYVQWSINASHSWIGGCRSPSNDRDFGGTFHWIQRLRSEPKYW